MNITIIGCGNMGNGLAERLSKTNQVSLYDRHFEKAQKIEQSGYGKAYTEIKNAIDQSELVILAIKPQNLKEAGPLIEIELQKGQIVVSLLAGISLETLKQFFPKTPIVRMMPNLALIYGDGVIGLSSAEKMIKKDRESLTELFKPLGKIYWLPEDKINGLTALTGSGPAFFFSMVEAMIDAGIAMGFEAKDAQRLVYQMLQGSLTLLERTEKHPGELRWQISSPQGTTIEGLKRLQELAIPGGIMNAFLTAYERANKLLDSIEKIRIP